MAYRTPSRVPSAATFALLAVALVVIAVACGLSRGAHAAPAGSEGGFSEDAALFEATVRAIADSSKAGRGGAAVDLRVDPRPLVADPAVSEATTSTLAGVPRTVVTAREEILRRLGIPVADVFALGPCPGVMVPAPSAEQRRGCPARRTLVVILGLPRGEGAYFPPGGIDERQETAGRDLRSIRVIERALGPAASVTRVYDYVMAPVQGHWKLAKRQALAFIE